jgi:tetratricopeptide (TPR) repeat protein
MFWPADLAVFYPHRRHQLPLLEIALAVAFLIAVTVTTFTLRKRSPYLLVGWLWYLSMLVPVVGVIQVHAEHADRYTYLPQIGLYLLVTWAIADLSASWHYRRQVLSVAAAIVISALGWSARLQTAYWRDSELLWDHAIAVTSDNDMAHANLADLLLRRGDLEGAISHCEEALRIRPRNPDAENNLGLALLQKGDESDAAVHFKKCLEIAPDHMNAAPNLAWVLATSSNSSTRDGPKAVELAEKVHRRAGHPNAIVLRTLAAAYAETGRFSDAIEAAEQAMEIAKATGNEGLVTDLERNIAAYRLNQPLRSSP